MAMKPKQCSLGLSRSCRPEDMARGWRRIVLKTTMPLLERTLFQQSVVPWRLMASAQPLKKNTLARNTPAISLAPKSPCGKCFLGVRGTSMTKLCITELGMVHLDSECESPGLFQWRSNTHDIQFITTYIAQVWARRSLSGGEG